MVYGSLSSSFDNKFLPHSGPVAIGVVFIHCLDYSLFV